MELIGTCGDRELYYINTETNGNWPESIPQEEWSVVVLIEQQDEKKIEQIAQACLKNMVVYISATGKESKWAHDWFDKTMLANKVREGKPIKTADNWEYDPMTVWDDSITEALWFSIYTAHNEYRSTKKIVFLQGHGESVQLQLSNLLEKFNSGFIP
jgi:hypothetical protein